MTEYKRVLIQPGERRRSTGHKITTQIRMHNYQKNTNLFRSVQNVLSRLRLTDKKKKALQGANVRTSCISLSLSQNSYRTTQTNAGDIRDKQKLAQNVFRPEDQQ